MIALLELKDIHRSYQSGDERVDVLKGISLRIHAGEMVAIMGASGSGKSTLMNILGCLDRPSSGQYLLEGEDVEELDADRLAEIRREHFGFIFQRYHLLPHLSAQHNVEMPAVYAGMGKTERHKKAQDLLQRLGLADRTEYRPGQLSGGQQQRVSIARALMNGGQIILADEPTGALDSHSGKEVMAILKQLHSLGHTIIIVTHDPNIAEQAERIIELHDGEVIADRLLNNKKVTSSVLKSKIPVTKTNHSWKKMYASFSEAFSMAWKAMSMSKLRTGLTMLGIIIGIASVVSILVIGNAAKQKVLGEISAIGSNNINIYPGSQYGDTNPLDYISLKPSDMEALKEQPYVDSVSPIIGLTNLRLRYGNTDVAVLVSGINEQLFKVFGMKAVEGTSITAEQVKNQAQVVVIDNNVKKALFPGVKNVVGKVVILGDTPLTVIGIASENKLVYQGNTLKVWLPYSTLIYRVIGQNWLDQIVVKVKPGYDSVLAEKQITALLMIRHGKKDFFTYNLDTVVKTAEKTGQTLQLFLVLVAVISLIVGGIGVMNIMLVSVTERTKEIGIRMAVGARTSDVLQQFLIEALLVCLVGGILGISLSFIVGFILHFVLPGWYITFPISALVSAFLCASVIGIIFGYLPARNASRLNPVDALARD